MKIIDRFTRDRVSRYVWAVLTVGCLLGVFFARQGQTRALGDQVSAAQAQTRHIADTVLFNNLSHVAMTKLIPSPLYRDIYVALQSQVFTDATIARVRVWTPDGILQYSTHERDQVGLLQTQDKTLIDQAMKGQSVSAKVLTKFNAASTGNDQTPTNLLEVFVPLHVPDWISVTGVVEVDYYYDNLVQAAHQPWSRIMVSLLGLAALCLLMTLLSLRKPLKTLGAGVASGSGGDGVEPKRGGKHAAAPASDQAAKTFQQEAERAAARATKAEADAASLREELKGSRKQLKEADAKIAEKSVDRPGETSQTPVNELEREIVLTARAHAAEASLREVERRAEAAEKKAKKLEQRARAAEAAVASTTAETSETVQDRGVAQASQAAAAAAEAALAAKETELAAAKSELDRAHADLEAKSKEAESAASSVAAAEAAAEAAAAAAAAMAAQQIQPQEAAPVAVDDAVFVKLEQRIVAAEQRARDAEARLADLQAARSAPRDQPPEDAVTATAGDLRSRLARTAARKKLGADDATAAAAAAESAAAGSPDEPSGETAGPTTDP